jgi:FdhD protein|tara:strand:+ start:88552 stop:89355 length:804 start_codon:yes stop_codon:yes gene_type:complete
MSQGYHNISLRRIALNGGGDAKLDRALALEVPIALDYCGLGYAVMMATPTDLEEFAIGHAVAEGLVSSADQVSQVDVAKLDGGYIVRATLPEEAREAIFARARTRVSDSSCGLCGVESIEEALRSLPQVTASIMTKREAIAKALAALPEKQYLNQETGAAHSAAFCCADGEVICLREDVGRHNALDKLIGAMAVAGRSMGDGFILLSARCSFELVEKTVRSGGAMLVTISAPTSLAAQRAKAAGLTLCALARSDSMLLVHDPKGLFA